MSTPITTPTHLQAQKAFIQLHNLKGNWELSTKDYKFLIEQIEDINAKQLGVTLDDLIGKYHRIDSATMRPIRDGYNVADSLYFQDPLDVVTSLQGDDKFDDFDVALTHYSTSDGDNPAIVAYENWSYQKALLAA